MLGTVEFINYILHDCNNPLFYPQTAYDSHLCCKSTAIIIKILNFCVIRAVVFLQSYVIMPVSSLRKTESKRICQISGLKSGRVTRLRNLSIGRLLESLINSI